MSSEKMICEKHVAIELKTGKFKPEYISKLDFYLEASINPYFSRKNPHIFHRDV